MKEFVGNNIKEIALYGQAITGVVLLAILVMIYFIVRRNKFFLPKGALNTFAVSVLLFCSILLMGAFVKISRMKPNILPIIEQMDGMIGNTAPPLKYIRISDSQEKLIEEHQGQILVVNYWATWCKPCLKEIPDLVALESKYRNQGLKVLLISDEKIDRLKKYAKKNQINLEIGTTQNFNWADLGNERPATFLIDKDGIVIDYFTGSRDFVFFEQQIRKFLR